MYLYPEVFVGGVCALTFHIVTVPAPFTGIIHFIRANTVRAKNNAWDGEESLANCIMCCLFSVSKWQYGPTSLPQSDISV